MSPVFGLLVDKLGKNIIWVLCAVVATLAAHIMLAFTFWNPWIAMVTILKELIPCSALIAKYDEMGSLLNDSAEVAALL